MITIKLDKKELARFKKELDQMSENYSGILNEAEPGLTEEELVVGENIEVWFWNLSDKIGKLLKSRKKIAN